MTARDYKTLGDSSEKSFVNRLGVEILRRAGVETDAVFEFSLIWNVNCLPVVEAWSYERDQAGQLVFGQNGDLIATGKMHQINTVEFGEFLNSLEAETV